MNAKAYGDGADAAVFRERQWMLSMWASRQTREVRAALYKQARTVKRFIAYRRKAQSSTDGSAKR